MDSLAMGMLALTLKGPGGAGQDSVFPRGGPLWLPLTEGCVGRGWQQEEQVEGDFRSPGEIW